MVNAMTTKIARFQYDIRNGMTIQDALTKHGLTFLEAFQKTKKPKNQKKKKKKKWVSITEEKYIQSRNNHYYVRKTINGRTRLFGTYKTLEDAVKIRDYCMEHGWKQYSIDKYCEILGIERCKHQNRRRNKRYH